MKAVAGISGLIWSGSVNAALSGTASGCARQQQFYAGGAGEGRCLVAYVRGRRIAAPNAECLA
jgi:hypothetical protein